MTITSKGHVRTSLLVAMAFLITSGLLAACTKVPYGKSERASELFVQSADAGTLMKRTDGTYALVLQGISPSTVSFSDRPARSARSVETGTFVDSWGSEFGVIAPNAALEISGANESADTVILAISNPHFDLKAGTITYDASIVPVGSAHALEGFKDRADDFVPESFGLASLFIDGGEAPSSAAAPPTKFVIANNSGRPDSDIYVALTDGNPGKYAPITLTATPTGDKQYMVPLTDLPHLTGTSGPRYFELEFGALPGHTTGSLLWLGYGYGSKSPIEVSPTAPSPDWASAVGKARFANVEQAYVAPSAVNQGDTTYVNQYSIPMDIEACDADGSNCDGLYMKYFTDCITEAMQSEISRSGGTWAGDSGVAHYDSAGNFVRITSPDTNATGWPSLAGYTQSLNGQTYQIYNSFGTVDSTQPKSTAFPSEEGYYAYTGTTRDDGVTVLTGTIGRQVNGPHPSPGREGNTVTIQPGDLAGAIYSQAGIYASTGTDTSTSNNNDAYNSVYADFVTGLTSGYWGGKYGNNNQNFGTGSNVPFAAARNSGEDFLAYSPYSEVMWHYSNAYSMPYGERYNNGGHPSPLITMKTGGQWKVTIHPDVTPGGCAGGWQPGS